MALGGSSDERAGLPKLGEVDSHAELVGSRDQLTSAWQSGRQSGSSLYIRSEITDGQLNCLTTADLIRGVVMNPFRTTPYPGQRAVTRQGLFSPRTNPCAPPYSVDGSLTSLSWPTQYRRSHQSNRSTARSLNQSSASSHSPSSLPDNEVHYGKLINPHSHPLSRKFDVHPLRSFRLISTIVPAPVATIACQ